MLFWELHDQCTNDLYQFRKLLSDEIFRWKWATKFGQIIIILRDTEIIQQKKNIVSAVSGAKKPKALCISLEKCSC